jgi:hypothetical protein
VDRVLNPATFGDVDYKHHQINDLCTSNDGADE